MSKTEQLITCTCILTHTYLLKILDKHGSLLILVLVTVLEAVFLKNLRGYWFIAQARILSRATPIN